MKAILETTKNEWETLAKLDPLWAILGESNKRFGKWEIDKFFITGEKEITEVIVYLKRKGVLLKKINRVLDFGCGLGRLTRALAKHFPSVYGLDISETMIKKAKNLNVKYNNCKFLVNRTAYTSMFPNNHFDFIYSNIVLQHFPNGETVLNQISDFFRILKPGGIAFFQLPSSLPFLNRLHPRRRLYYFLKSLGFGFKEKFLYNKLQIYGFSMLSVPVKKVKNLIRNNKVKIIDIVNNQTINTTYLLQKL